MYVREGGGIISLRWEGPPSKRLEEGEGVSHAACRGRLQGTGLASSRALGGNVLMCSKFSKEARWVEQSEQQAS